MGLPPLKIRKEHILGFPQGRSPRPRLIDPGRFGAGVVPGAVEDRAGGTGHRRRQPRPFTLHSSLFTLHPLAARHRIQCRRSRQASGAIRPSTPITVLAFGTGTSSPPEAKAAHNHAPHPEAALASTTLENLPVSRCKKAWDGVAA
jgi:hypothetical protein